ncbi:MAG: SH3 domain-containing protein [Verrucomicrobia bacterium]|nr:SH3 domain-containing protein [Verrucomicrobiota bacterium]
MRFEVTEPYEEQYKNPICFEEGEEVVVCRPDDQFPGWFWCRAATGIEGWVHGSFLASHSGTTTATESYSARELTVAAGDSGNILRQLDGWALVSVGDSAEGWLPLTHIRKSQA